MYNVERDVVDERVRYMLYLVEFNTSFGATTDRL